MRRFRFLPLSRRLLSSPAANGENKELLRKIFAGEFRNQKEAAVSSIRVTRAAIRKGEGLPNQVVASIDDLGEYLPPPQCKTFHIETYGCQMNSADSEIVSSVLNSVGMTPVASVDEADVVLLNTCAVRENAEGKVWERLRVLGCDKRRRGKPSPDARRMIVGVLGCMAERLKEKLVKEERLCDLVVGPDQYRTLAHLLSAVEAADKATGGLVSVDLSSDETYASIVPHRSSASPGAAALVSIMRGCNNMCSFCIVPFTRGRERSRDVPSIEEEVKRLSEEGCKEILLLGQNVNSYHDTSTPSHWPLQRIEGARQLSNDGFRTVYKRSADTGVTFAELLQRVAVVDPNMRVRFTSPHPKDFPEAVLEVMRDHDNICKSIHLPAQSGSSVVLERMRRGYSRETYLELADRIRSTVPGVALSTDMISGFCGESEQDHQDTLTLMARVNDDVPNETKQRRLQEVIDLFHRVARETNQKEIGNIHLVLVEKRSRRDASHWIGRSDTFKKVVLRGSQAVDKLDLSSSSSSSSSFSSSPSSFVDIAPGQFVLARVTSATSSSLIANPLSVSDICQWGKATRAGTLETLAKTAEEGMGKRQMQQQ